VCVSIIARRGGCARARIFCSDPLSPPTRPTCQLRRLVAGRRARVHDRPPGLGRQGEGGQARRARLEDGAASADGGVRVHIRARRQQQHRGAQHGVHGRPQGRQLGEGGGGRGGQGVDARRAAVARAGRRARAARPPPPLRRRRLGVRGPQRPLHRQHRALGGADGAQAGAGQEVKREDERRGRRQPPRAAPARARQAGRHQGGRQRPSTGQGAGRDGVHGAPVGGGERRRRAERERLQARPARRPARRRQQPGQGRGRGSVHRRRGAPVFRRGGRRRRRRRRRRRAPWLGRARRGRAVARQHRPLALGHGH